MKTLLFCFFVATLSAAEQGSFDKTLEVSGPVDLDVKTDSGSITVTPGSSSSLHVHAIIKADHGWFGSGDVQQRIEELERNPPVEQNGSHIRIGYVHERNLLKDISIQFDIQTPANTQLRAHADSGAIQVEGIKGPVDAKTDSGGIRIRDVQADVHATADSGGIQLNHINGAVYAKVDSGGIEANEVNGSIEAQADSGAIRLAQTKPAPIHAKTESGGVHVKLASGAGYNLSIDTESGPINVPAMTVRSSFSEHHVEGQVGNGGPLVQIRVDSGGAVVE